MSIRKPTFTYDGGDADVYAGDNYWYIVCRSSGTLKLKYDKKIDVFLVGGGGAGGSGNGASGGGGGYVKTVRDVAVDKETGYAIVIGNGGRANQWSAGGRGGSTSAFGYSVLGGNGGGSGDDKGATGGAGGSGGGAGTYDKGEAGGKGGGNGNNGANTSEAYGGKGSGSSTRGFGQNLEDNVDGYNPYTFFAGGGGGSSRDSAGGAGGAGGGGKGGGEGQEIENGTSGTANTGGGGGGASWESVGGNGGSGVVIIRSTMPDFLPVFFDGTHLTEIYYKIGNSGTPHKLETLTFNGTKLF